MPQAKYDQLIDKLAAAESIVEDAANERMFAGLARIERLIIAVSNWASTIKVGGRTGLWEGG